MTIKAVGVVRALNLYPVKSMRAVSAQEAQCYWYGLNGDRKWGFVQNGDRSGFPWLTGRELPLMLGYQPYFTDPANPLTSKVRVQTPSGQDLPVDSPELKNELAALSTKDISVMKLKRGAYDCMPVSLITMNTIESLTRVLGAKVDSRRFRSNLLIETEAGAETPEETWIGQTILFGKRPDSARLQVSYRTERCMMINLNPDGGDSDARILKGVAAWNAANAGVYAAVEKPGTIRVGDAVYLDPA